MQQRTDNASLTLAPLRERWQELTGCTRPDWALNRHSIAAGICFSGTPAHAAVQAALQPRQAVAEQAQAVGNTGVNHVHPLPASQHGVPAIPVPGPGYELGMEASRPDVHHLDPPAAKRAKVHRRPQICKLCGHYRQLDQWAQYHCRQGVTGGGCSTPQNLMPSQARREALAQAVKRHDVLPECDCNTCASIRTAREQQKE